MKSVLITAAGGPSAENVIQSMKNSMPIHIVGTDCDKHLINLSSADSKAYVSACTEKEYCGQISELYKKYRCSMFLPISDTEINTVVHNTKMFPPSPLPNEFIIDICQDKGQFYSFLQSHGFSIPETNFSPGMVKSINTSKWLRANKGAGGNLGVKIDNMSQLQAHLTAHFGTPMMLSDFLGGKDYSFMSMWANGELCFSVTKERLSWVYHRIGTAAVQKTIVHPEITKLCNEVIKTLIDVFQPDLTGLMMVDLKEDNQGNIFITEINSGRAGTVSFWYTLGSLAYYGDHRANFHYQLYNAHNDLAFTKYGNDILPPEMYYMRHIDLGALFIYKDVYWKFNTFPEKVRF
jgi:hypothetical protein